MLYFCGLGLMHALQVDQFDHNFLENSFIAKNRSIKIWDDYNREIISFLNDSCFFFDFRSLSLSTK